MQDEVLLPGAVVVCDHIIEVRGEFGVVELLHVGRLQPQVLRLQAGPGRRTPLGDHVAPRTLGQRGGCGLRPSAHLGMEPRRELQDGQGREFRCSPGATDQRPHARVHEPVHESRLERVGGHAQLGEHRAEAVLHRRGHQILHDRRDRPEAVGAVVLPRTGSGWLETQIRGGGRHEGCSLWSGQAGIAAVEGCIVIRVAFGRLHPADHPVAADSVLCPLRH